MLYQIQVYGCQMNKYDALLIERRLTEAGHVPAQGESDAELILFVTCTVRDTAESRIYGRLGQLRPAKESGRIKVLGVCGCMAQGNGEEIFQKAPHVDLVVGTEAYPRIAELVEAVVREDAKQIDVRRHFGGDETVRAFDETGPKLDPEKVSYPAFVSIMRGCNYRCTYCIVPSVRGDEMYRNPDEIVAEVRRMAEAGYRSVTLIGQVVNSYRFGETGLAELLRRVSDVPGMDRVSFVTSHPRSFGPEIIEAVAERPNIVPYFHIPIQSGADRLLKRMARRYKVDDYRRLLDRIRTTIPEASVTSDLIVGFPGETPKDHDKTLQVVEEMRWDGLFTFRYSPRRGTPAAGFDDPVPEPLKIERLEEVNAVQKRISLEINEAIVGSDQEVFIETVNGNPRGRTWQNRATVIHEAPEGLSVGRTIPIRITEATPYTLKGQPASGDLDPSGN